MKEKYRIISIERCFECGNNDNLEFHHIIPKILGGTKTLPLCINCHSKVHNYDFSTFRNLGKVGIIAARERGVVFGKPIGYRESTEDFLNKPKVKEIIKLLNSNTNFTVAEIVRLTGTSLNLFYKVKEVLKLTKK